MQVSRPGDGPAGKARTWDFGTSIGFLQGPPGASGCGILYMITSMPHGTGSGNGNAWVDAYRVGPNGVLPDGWLMPTLNADGKNLGVEIVAFNNYAPPGMTGYVNSRGQLVLSYNQQADGKSGEPANAQTVGYNLVG